MLRIMKSTETMGERKLPTTIEECHKLILDLYAIIERLEARLGQNSSTSSKPPSSDGPSKAKPPPRPSSKRKRGGQPGHGGTTRRSVTTPDQITEHRPERCGRCDARLPGHDASPERRQQWELPELPKALVTEHRLHTLTCSCGHRTKAAAPKGVEGAVSFGPNLNAMVGYLSGGFGMSHRHIQALLLDGFGVDVALGTITNCQFRVSTSLDSAMAEADAAVAGERVLHADETSWATKGKRSWLWVAVGARVSRFIVHPSRGRAAAGHLLSRWEQRRDGILCTDRWGVYRTHALERRQLCLAHLERQFRELTLFQGKMRAIGKALVKQMGRLWQHWSGFKRGKYTREELQKRMLPVQAAIHDALVEGAQTSHARSGRCKEILKEESAMWTYLKYDGVEPTNNISERSLRFAVTWRKRSLGSQSGIGEMFVERLLTARATLKTQGRNLLGFLRDSMRALMHGTAPPALIPA